MPGKGGERKIKALVLSCNTGEGHNSVAKAIKECFDANGEQCDIVDSLKFISDRVSGFMSKGHVLVYRHIPVLFRKGYSHAEGHEELFEEDSFTYKLMAAGAENLYNYIVENGYDTVICSHVFPSLMLTEVLKEYKAELRTCYVSTDYTISPGTIESRLDGYFMSDAVSAEQLEGQLDTGRVIESGIPVRQDFFRRVPKPEAKKAMGIPEDAKHILMMCGSMGCGPIKRLAQRLAESLDDGQYLTVVCGTNRRLENRLENRAEERENVRVLGYCDNIPLLMDSADLYLTKPGGISVSEAAVKALPMVLVNTVAGCEEYNLDYAVECGLAKTADTVEELAELCVRLINNDDELIAMHEAGRRIAVHNGAQIVYEYLKKMELNGKKEN